MELLQLLYSFLAAGKTSRDDRKVYRIVSKIKKIQDTG